MADQTASRAGGLDLSTKLAFDRTWVAYERTMLAWVRSGNLANNLRLQRLQVLSNRERRRPAHQLPDRGAAIWAIAGEYRPGFNCFWRLLSIGRIFGRWERSMKDGHVHWRSS